MLHVIEPWLFELAGQRQFGALPDGQLAMSSVAIVLVFSASQVGLALAGFMIARGFSLGRSVAGPARDEKDGTRRNISGHTVGNDFAQRAARRTTAEI